VCWDQRRWACRQQACPRRTFAEHCPQVPPRRRLTTRLLDRLVRSVSASTRAVSDVAREYTVSWWSVNAALVTAAAALTGQAPAGVRWLGVDETRTRAVRWLLEESGWKRSDPWMTSFVDLDPAHGGELLGLAPVRSERDRLVGLADTRIPGWYHRGRGGPECPVRRRAAPRPPGRATGGGLLASASAREPDADPSPPASDPAVLRPSGHRDDGCVGVSPVAAARRASSVHQAVEASGAAVRDPRPTGEIRAAWAAKECLRQLLDDLPATTGPFVTERRRSQRGDPAAGLRPYVIRPRLERLYQLAADANIPEVTRLAATVETWWPTVEAYLRLRVTNARTEGYNRKIKQVKRVACGFRDQDSYQRRIMLNNAAPEA
jgi:transposase